MVLAFPFSETAVRNYIGYMYRVYSFWFQLLRGRHVSVTIGEVAL